MAEFSFEEAVYGALCYLFGSDDNELSVKEQKIMNESFADMYTLSDEGKGNIMKRWSSKGSASFFHNVTDSLNSYSKGKKLEALESLCIIMEQEESKTRFFAPPDRFEYFLKILNAISISQDELENYVEG
jgi:hypothetical protein